jgi:hypothetical protein
MNRENGNDKELDETGDEAPAEDTAEDAFADTIVIETDDQDNVGDMSVEIDVDELMAKIETDDSDEAVAKRDAHRKLKELREKRRNDEDVGGTYNFNLDDD